MESYIAAGSSMESLPCIASAEVVSSTEEFDSITIRLSTKEVIYCAIENYQNCCEDYGIEILDISDEDNPQEYDITNWKEALPIGAKVTNIRYSESGPLYYGNKCTVTISMDHGGEAKATTISLYNQHNGAYPHGIKLRYPSGPTWDSVDIDCEL